MFFPPLVPQAHYLIIQLLCLSSSVISITWACFSIGLVSPNWARCGLWGCPCRQGFLGGIHFFSEPALLLVQARFVPR